MVALETGTTPPPTGSSRLSSSTVLFVAALGAFLAFLDVTIVNVAFPNIRESFPGTSIGELSWVLNAYNIVLAASMVAWANSSLPSLGASDCSATRPRRQIPLNGPGHSVVRQ